MTKEKLQGYLAEGLSLEQIGRRVGRNPSTVSYHLKKHGLKPVNQGKHANKGTISRSQLETLVAEGLSIRQIGARLDRSPGTIRHWMRKSGLKTVAMEVGARRPELRAAKRAGLRQVESRCAHHGTTIFILENRGYYRCAKCRAERVSAWRRRAKRRLIETAGGACVLCRYDEYAGALQFHHLEPSEKKFSISREGVTRSFAELKAEAAKCVLLCANCHAEVEGGYTALRN